MSVATAILEHVQSSAKLSREALIAEIERTHDPKLVSSTVSTMIRRGELKESERGYIELGDDEAIEKARLEREQRKADRDRPRPMPAPATAPGVQVALVPETPRKWSTASARAICSAIQDAVTKHGPLRAADIARHVPDVNGSNIYHHTAEMVKRGELMKRGAMYGVSTQQFDARIAASLQPNLDADTPTSPIFDVPAAVAEAKQQSRTEDVPAAATEAADEVRLDVRFPSGVASIGAASAAPASRIKSIAEVARKHAVTAPEEYVLQIGDIYIAVTAPATVAERVLSAALAVLGAPA